MAVISGNVPAHLVAMAKTGFLTAPRKPVRAWERIAKMVTISLATQTLTDIGGAPMPKRERGQKEFFDFIEKSLSVTTHNVPLAIGISGNAIEDDQTGGSLISLARGAGSNYDRYIAQQAYQALNDGDSATAGIVTAGYDGLPLFSNSHVDKGGLYQTAQDNLDSLVLNMTNFETVLVKARKFRDDQGEFTEYAYDTLVVSPQDERAGHNITDNKEDSSTADRALNPYAGKFETVVSPKLDDGAWFITASQEITKPVIIVMKKQPELVSAYYDPIQPEGGMYYFVYDGRFEFYPGDWKTAAMGHS